jgi:Flp pilus assembly protein TadD
MKPSDGSRRERVERFILRTVNMDQSNPASATRRFQLVRGGGLRTQKEAEQLDRFLVGTDPILLTSLQDEEQEIRQRSRKWVWGLALAVGLLILIPLLWWSGLRLSQLSQGKLAGGRTSPDHEKARQLLEGGRQLMAEEREDRDDEALQKFQAAVRLAPDMADAWADLGTCQLRNYQSELAEQDYRQALALEPGNQRALHGLGNLYLRRSEPRKAEEIWARGGLDRQLARLYLLQGRFREARARLASLLAQSPDDELLYRMEQAASSQSLSPDLRCLLEPEPTGLSSWAEQGWRLVKEKRYAPASAAFGRALAEVPKDVNAMSGMGVSLLALHRSAEAKPYFEQALAIDKDHVRSLNGLAYCLKDEGRVGEAIALWERLSQLYPYGQYGTPEGLAWTYYEIRDYRQAAVYFARLVKRYPYDTRMLDALNVAVQNIGVTPAAPAN